MAGVIELLKRSFDYQRINGKVWYVPIILLTPGVAVLSYALMRWIGLPLPVPRFPALQALVMFVAFFVAALGEELGWSGYVIDPMQERSTALQAAIVLGLVWAVWHALPLMDADRSRRWIAWWSLGTVASRVLMTWLYNNTGKSVFAVALYHDISNLSWQLFPNSGSHWDPRIHGLIIAFAAAIVTVVWGPQTLARHRTCLPRDQNPMVDKE
jgi:membrane protease YdiL (CAAX protease family)